MGIGLYSPQMKDGVAFLHSEDFLPEGPFAPAFLLRGRPDAVRKRPCASAVGFNTGHFQEDHRELT